MPSSTAAVSTAAASSSSTAAVSTAAASSSTAVPYWQVVCTGVAYSALAPAISCVLTNPMDVAKTRLNMDRELRPPGAPRAFAGIVDCIRQAWAAEGLAGVQRGLGFAVVREASKNAFRLGLYDPLEAALDTKLSSLTYGEISVSPFVQLLRTLPRGRDLCADAYGVSREDAQPDLEIAATTKLVAPGVPRATALGEKPRRPRGIRNSRTRLSLEAMR